MRLHTADHPSLIDEHTRVMQLLDGRRDGLGQRSRSVAKDSCEITEVEFDTQAFYGGRARMTVYRSLHPAYAASRDRMMPLPAASRSDQVRTLSPRRFHVGSCLLRRHQPGWLH